MPGNHAIEQQPAPLLLRYDPEGGPDPTWPFLDQIIRDYPHFQALLEGAPAITKKRTGDPLEGPPVRMGTSNREEVGSLPF
jgi:hypothetical protein